MKLLAITFAAVALWVVCGCDPRYTEVDRPLTVSEMSGVWLLTPPSYHSLMSSGWEEKGHLEFAVILNADGSCSYRSVLDGAYVKTNGRWWTNYEPSDEHKNRLHLEWGDFASSRIRIAQDSGRTILLEPQGGPNDGKDLVYVRARAVKVESGSRED